jgi:hypothetical protein
LSTIRIGNETYNRGREEARRLRQLGYGQGAHLNKSNMGVEVREVDRSRVAVTEPTKRTEKPPRPKRRRSDPAASKPTPLPHAVTRPSTMKWKPNHERAIKGELGAPSPERQLRFYGHNLQGPAMVTKRVHRMVLAKRGRRSS